MATLTTKYSVGDTVHYASTTTTTKQHPCPDCKGSRKWKAISPAGEEYEFGCPRCGNRYRSDNALSLDYAVHVGLVRPLTIGSVRIDSHSDRPVSYMCIETGIGSGSVYYEDTLFPTEEEARAVADTKAALSDKTVEWVAKLYDKTLELSDYALTNALKKSAEIEKRKARYAVEDLLSSLDDAYDPDDVRRAIKRWKGEAEDEAEDDVSKTDTVV